MSIIEAIFLGIIQGATEFLPISSSGHSILLPLMFGMGEPGLNEVIIAHQGTLLAVLIYFWQDIWNIIKGVFGGLAAGDPMGTPESRLGWFIVVGSIPAAVTGLLFEETFKTVFDDPRFAAAFLLLTAALLVIGELMLSGRKRVEDMNVVDALSIGLFQMFALLPGVSRSGSTIVGGVMRGLSRELAARYSFLMSIPVIAGAGVLGVLDLMESGNLAAQLPSLIAAFVSAAVVGYACIAFLMNWLRQRSLYPFAVYCAALGLSYLLYAFFFATG